MAYGKNARRCGALVACALLAEMAATAGMSLIDWEADWAESGTALALGMAVAAVLAVAVLALLRKNSGKPRVS